MLWCYVAMVLGIRGSRSDLTAVPPTTPTHPPHTQFLAENETAIRNQRQQVELYKVRIHELGSCLHHAPAGALGEPEAAVATTGGGVEAALAQAVALDAPTSPIIPAAALVMPIRPAPAAAAPALAPLATEGEAVEGEGEGEGIHL